MVRVPISRDGRTAKPMLYTRVSTDTERLTDQPRYKETPKLCTHVRQRKIHKPLAHRGADTKTHRHTSTQIQRLTDTHIHRDTNTRYKRHTRHTRHTPDTIHKRNIQHTQDIDIQKINTNTRQHAAHTHKQADTDT